MSLPVIKEMIAYILTQSGVEAEDVKQTITKRNFYHMNSSRGENSERVMIPLKDVMLNRYHLAKGSDRYSENKLKLYLSIQKMPGGELHAETELWDNELFNFVFPKASTVVGGVRMAYRKDGKFLKINMDKEKILQIIQEVHAVL